MQSSRMSETDVDARLREQLPRWTQHDGTIRRTWRTHGWKATLMAVNAIGHVAELAWHHPEIIINYASVEVRLRTHDAGGITDKDFALAMKLDACLDWRPSQDTAALGGIPADNRSAAYLRD